MVSLAGGGVYDPTTGFIKAEGSFHCIETVGNQNSGLYPCEAGQSGHWHAVTLLASRLLRCIGAPEPQNSVGTDDDTVVFTATFYLRGSGNPETRLVEVFVSNVDEKAYYEGIQNVWVQGVGCGDAIATFNQTERAVTRSWGAAPGRLVIWVPEQADTTHRLCVGAVAAEQVIGPGSRYAISRHSRREMMSRRRDPRARDGRRSALMVATP